MLSQLLPCKWAYGSFIKMLSDRRLSIAVRLTDRAYTRFVLFYTFSGQERN